MSVYHINSISLINVCLEFLHVHVNGYGTGFADDTLVLPTNLPRLGDVAPPTPPATYALVGVMNVIGVMIVVCILNAGPSLER